MTTPTHLIGVCPDMLSRLLDDVGRHRALTDEESLMVETLIRRRTQCRVYVKWTADLDRKLLAVARKRSEVRKFAHRHQMTPQCAYDRLHKLRKKAKSPIPDLRFKE